MLRGILMCFLVMGLTGCTTLQPVERPTPQAIQADIHRGDQVHLETDRGLIYEFRVTSISSEGIGGRVSGREQLLRYEHISSISVRRHSAAKTASLVIGTVAVVGTLVYYIFKGVNDVSQAVTSSGS